jgi:peptidoglycan/xylan/chitin deacetylase (PgdA/CDA1 family)
VVARRVLLAAGGAVLLTSTAAAVAADARAHGPGTQPRPAPNVAADRAGGTSGTRASTSSGPGEASSAASPPTRQHSAPAQQHSAPAQQHPAPAQQHSAPAQQHPASARPATRPPRRQPRLPYGEPMFTVKDGPKVVALTIDDGPSPVYTPQILRILRRYGVTASFSMIGLNAATYPGVAREVAEAGHMIVNHTWNHYNLRYMSAAGVWNEIARATDAIHAATGKHPSMFRAPYGVWAPAVFSYCAQAGLTPLAWSVDPRDWSRPGVRSIVRTVESDTRTGSVILEHDGGGNRSQTVAALKIWLPRLLDAGYQFTTP